MERVKKCTSCNKEKKLHEFGRNRVSIDGLTAICKDCRSAQNRERRRSLDVMIKKIPASLAKDFTELHTIWREAGFTPHSKPVVYKGRQVMTLIEMRKKGVNVDQLTEEGELIRSFDSLNDARRETGIGHSYINWSIKNRLPIGGFLWRRKKS